MTASPQRRSKLRALRRALARLGGGEWCAVGLRPDRLPAEERTWRFAPSPAPLDAGDGGLSGLVLADALEHAGDETVVLAEARRALRPLGVLVLTVPRLSRGPVRLLKRLLGLTPAFYGHCREGYSRQGLRLLLEGTGFKVLEAATFARPLAALVTALADRIRGPRGEEPPKRSGPLRVLAFAADGLCRLLDGFLFLVPGHGLLMVARRRP